MRWFARIATLAPLLVACSDELGETPSEPEPVYVHAAGVRLTDLRVSQGVESELIVGDEVRGGEQYRVRLLAGRPMLLRASFSVHHEFEPRELLGRLSVRYEPGTLDAAGEPLDELLRDSQVMVTGDSSLGSLTGTFAWYLEPDEVVPGMRVRVDAYELEPLPPGELEPLPDPNAEGAARIDAPALPWAQARAAIELESPPMRIIVELVPIEHRLDDCVERAEVDADDLAALAELLAENNPVHEVELRVREPIVIDEPIGGQDDGFAPVLSRLSMARVAAEVPANVYWYGLVASCDGFPSELAGQAFGIPSAPTAELAYQRVAAGRWLGDGAAAAETFVHELGHGQGRKHVHCSGSEAGVDGDYPHPGGITDAWGFGIYSLGLHSPTGSRDYMTYCANEWVSDYGWEQTWDFIEVLSDPEFDASALGAPLLIGAVWPSGRSDWWIGRGSAAGEASVALRWQLEGGERWAAALRHELPEGGVLITAPLPSGARRATLAGCELELASLPRVAP